MNFLLLNAAPGTSDSSDLTAQFHKALKGYGKVTITRDWLSLINYLQVQEYSAVFVDADVLSRDLTTWHRELARVKSHQLFIQYITSSRFSIEIAHNIQRLFKIIHLEELEDSLPETMEQLEAYHRFRESSGNQLAKGYLRPSGFGEFIGNSTESLSIYRQLMRVAVSDYTVLIQGESGSGKDLVARTIHDLSGRQKQPFLSMNCAAIPENLLESELFGFEKGAFTGATHAKAGKFEMADKGTLFLDEIGDMPITLQAKLLRVLEDNTIQPLGSLQEKQVDFRLLAATHQDLDDLIKKHRFREDLHYRLNVISIVLPPLSEHRTDIPLLILYYLGKLIGNTDQIIQSVEWDIIRKLTRENIGGNVRELENLLTRLVFQTEGDTIDVETLDRVLDQRGAGTKPESPVTDPIEIPEQVGVRPLKEVEREAIIHALKMLKGNISQTASQLGISRTALYRKINSYKLEEYLVD